MSDTEATKGKTGWTDRQRLAYFFNLVESSNVTLDYNNAPRPEGKSVGACKIMVHRLKGTLKEDIEVLRNGTSMPEDTPKKAASTPCKGKGKVVNANDDAKASPTKRGRKRKIVNAEKTPKDEEKEELSVKRESKDDEEHMEDEG